jgi:hypothetical protein
MIEMRKKGRKKRRDKTAGSTFPFGSTILSVYRIVSLKPRVPCLPIRAHHLASDALPVLSNQLSSQDIVYPQRKVSRAKTGYLLGHCASALSTMTAHQCRLGLRYTDKQTKNNIKCHMALRSICWSYLVAGHQCSLWKGAEFPHEDCMLMGPLHQQTPTLSSAWRVGQTCHQP